ncbi:sigma-70 family RNA polymerase sigma factor [Pectobacterium sp. PL64]|uniref:sigma-70 family RNA polymerase sigma factor n=1 Tax=Pectobacterium sp. PL64 TaxID=2738983 RepID=UPI001F0CCDB1|nr:sigma-70 family RNA polymerase sigma factor [Pectobacterium sp. PL64]UMO88317.1 sigma-70 family RNA polymerase sigma factor [Pectobacterium sp. PL64]
MTQLTSFWSDFYQTHQGWLRGWLCKKMGCIHQADDLTHDTFLKLLTLADPTAIRQPKAYLMVTANHVMIDQFRKRKLEQDALSALAVLVDGEEEHSAEYRVAISQLVATALHILTHELDEKVQRAFIMARVEGHDYRAIAEALHVSESSVKQYLAKAMVHFHSRIFFQEHDEA